MPMIVQMQRPNPPEHHFNILELHRQGWDQTQIARALGYSRRTVYNHLHERVFQPGKKRGRPSGSRKLMPFADMLRDALASEPAISMGRLYEDLRSRGYTGSLSILREFCRALRAKGR